MTDAEFVEEFAERLTLWLHADAARANAALLTPLGHAGYANVGHLLGQICFPRGIDPANPPREGVLEEVRFLTPVVQDRRITAFEAVSGADLQRRQQEMAERAARASAAADLSREE